MVSERIGIRDIMANGGILTALGYMMYVAWESMERDRWIAAHRSGEELLVLWLPVFLGIAVLCVLAVVIAHKGLWGAVRKSPLRWIVPLVSAASSMTLCLQRLAGDRPASVLVVTFALCTAWYVLVWTERFGTLGGAGTFAVVLMADVLSALFQILCVSIMGSTGLFIVTALMPVASSALLVGLPPVERDEPSETPPHTLRSVFVVCGVGVFGVLCFLLRSMIYVHPQTYGGPYIAPLSSLGALAVLALLGWALYRCNRGNFVELLIMAGLGLGVLLLAAAIAVTPFFKVGALWSMFTLLGSHCGYLVLLVGLAQACRVQGIHPVVAFGMTFAALYGGYSVGDFAGVQLSSIGVDVTGLLLGCAIIALLAVGLGLLALLRPAQLAPGILQAGEGEAKASPEPSESAETEDRFERAANEVADAHGLSPREREVFSLLVRGRSSTYVSNVLYISLNTTKKHIQHIYKKLGVHSNQEAISLVERRLRAGK